ncbi:MAG: prolyl-tRNA synthetase associated domain-containing protein [Clostridiales bacterium]
MNNIRKTVLDMLNINGIPYTLKEHPAVFTIEDMEALHLDKDEVIPKNLFLRDNKKTHYYLVVIDKNKRLDLKKLRQQLQSRSLTFASNTDLEKYLGLTQGSVSPLGILNDVTLSVEIILDTDIMVNKKIGIHPNENTATIWLNPKDLENLITTHGNIIHHIKL